MSNTEQNTEKDFLNEESLNTEEATNTAESQGACNETTSQGEPVETVETLKAELETLKDKQEELPDDSLSFAAIASDDTETNGLYYVKYIGKDDAKLKKFKGQLKMVAAG